jgi:hypothetical protein
VNGRCLSFTKNTTIMSEYPHHDFHGSHPSPRSAHYTAYQYGMRRRGFFRGRLLPFGLGTLVGYWWIGRHERHASCQRPKEVTYRRDDHPAMPVPDRPFERDVLARTVEPPQEFGSQISDKVRNFISQLVA